MKIEAQFKSEQNKLFFLDGKEVSLNDITCVSAKDFNNSFATQSSIFCIELAWTLVGLDEDSYNEEFLATFRDLLKNLEEQKKYTFIIPVADSSIDSEEKKEAFVQSFKHCARRIKDCANVIGFAVPQDVNATHFIEELSAKHAHYKFFSKDKQTLLDSSIVKI